MRVTKKVFQLLFILIVMNTSYVAVITAEKFIFNSEEFPYIELQVQVMPEFDLPVDWPLDEPGILVGYYGTIVNNSGADFEGEIEIFLPVNEKAFEVDYVADYPFKNDPEVQRGFTINKERGSISFTPSYSIPKGELYHFVIEYFSNPIVQENGTKKFTYTFNAMANIDETKIIFYAPLNAKDFTVDHETSFRQETSYGMELFLYEYKNLGINEQLSFDVSYIKPDHVTTLELMVINGVPDDDVHGKTPSNTEVQNPHVSQEQNEMEKTPSMNYTGVTIISISALISGLFIIAGFAIRNKQ